MSGLMLEDLITRLSPTGQWKLDDWFDWPPDLFLLTSVFLGDSGTYRYAVSPPTNRTWPKAAWLDEVAAEAGEWQRNLADGKRALPTNMCRAKEILRESLEKPLYDLYSRSKLEEREDLWEICAAMLELHAAADEACSRLGILRGPWSDIDRAAARFYFLADLLLTTRGTLSRVPKEFGIVLPKMRTPQVGLTLRSLSHYTSFHRTEVDVTWRAVSWLNRDENTVNILLVPWPFRIREKYFRPVVHSASGERLGSSRYFRYAPASVPEGEGTSSEPDGGDEPLPISEIIHLLDTALKEVDRIHMIVFPETALKESELEILQRELETYFSHDHFAIPMIISGILAPKSPGAASADDDGTDRIGATFKNKVSVSIFNAHKWYELSQYKHHRWRVDEQQIQRYNLGGALTGSANWWEAINIPKRQLSIIAPNGWLSLCPLICEDLARLEPVSELIRGIGPTLLIALLLDGPQLEKRWSARYASVLADDPGTSVLTLTSLGMVKRSLSESQQDQSRGEKRYTIALWKDQTTGWQPIDITEEHGAVVLSLAASWMSEVTADGREDGGNASVFTLEGFFPIPRAKTRVGKRVGNKVARKTAARREDMQTHLVRKGATGQFVGDRELQKAVDMLELSIWTCFVDVALDLAPEEALELMSWLLPKATLQGTTSGFRVGGDILALAHESMARFPEDWGPWNAESLEPAAVPSPELVRALESITEALTGNLSDDPGADEKKRHIAHWRRLIDLAWHRIVDLQQRAEQGTLKFPKSHIGAPMASDPNRIIYASAWGLLWSVHNRLAERRRRGKLRPEEASLLVKIESFDNRISREARNQIVKKRGRANRR